MELEQLAAETFPRRGVHYPYSEARERCLRVGRAVAEDLVTRLRREFEERTNERDEVEAREVWFVALSKLDNIRAAFLAPEQEQKPGADVTAPSEPEQARRMDDAAPALGTPSASPPDRAALIERARDAERAYWDSETDMRHRLYERMADFHLSESAPLRARITSLESALAEARDRIAFERATVDDLQIEAAHRGLAALKLQTALRRVSLALCEEVGGDHDAFHDMPGCSADDTCPCIVREILRPHPESPASAVEEK